MRREEQAAWSLGSGVVFPANWLFIDGNLSQGNGIFFFFGLLCLNPLPVKHDSPQSPHLPVGSVFVMKPPT